MPIQSGEQRAPRQEPSIARVFGFDMMMSASASILYIAGSIQEFWKAESGWSESLDSCRKRVEEHGKEGLAPLDRLVPSLRSFCMPLKIGHQGYRLLVSYHAKCLAPSITINAWFLGQLVLWGASKADWRAERGTDWQCPACKDCETFNTPQPIFKAVCRIMRILQVCHLATGALKVCSTLIGLMVSCLPYSFDHSPWEDHPRVSNQALGNQVPCLVRCVFW